MPIFIDVFHEFYGTAIVPTFIDIVPFLINIVPLYNLFLITNETLQGSFVSGTIETLIGNSSDCSPF